MTYTENQESVAYTQKKYIETVPKEVQTLELLDEVFKSVILCVFQKKLKEMMSKKLKKIMRTFHHI